MSARHGIEATDLLVLHCIAELNELETSYSRLVTCISVGGSAPQLADRLRSVSATFARLAENVSGDR